MYFNRHNGDEGGFDCSLYNSPLYERGVRGDFEDFR